MTFLVVFPPETCSNSMIWTEVGPELGNADVHGGWLFTPDYRNDYIRKVNLQK